MMPHKKNPLKHTEEILLKSCDALLTMAEILLKSVPAAGPVEPLYTHTEKVDLGQGKTRTITRTYRIQQNNTLILVSESISDS